MKETVYVDEDTGIIHTIEWECGDYIDSDAGEKMYLAHGESDKGKFFIGTARFYMDELLCIEEVEEDYELDAWRKKLEFKRNFKQFFNEYYALNE